MHPMPCVSSLRFGAVLRFQPPCAIALAPDARHGIAIGPLPAGLVTFRGLDERLPVSTHHAEALVAGTAGAARFIAVGAGLLARHPASGQRGFGRGRRHRATHPTGSQAGRYLPEYGARALRGRRNGRHRVDQSGDALWPPSGRVHCQPAQIQPANAGGLSYLALEKETAAGTIRNYPRGKFVQSTAIEVAEYGSFFMEGDTSKEVLLKEWERILAETGITINEREEVSAIRAREGYFEILTSASRSYQARYAVLAIGLRGSPRRLKLAGETPDRVFYSLIEPSEFQNRRLLVVGGGNAGTEVAQALADPQLHNIVSYSFRTPALGPPVTPENAEKISQLQRQGLITIYPASALTGLAPGKVVLEPFGAARSGELSAGANAIVITEPTELDNDCVFAMLGAELPTRFMESIGIQMERKGR